MIETRRVSSEIIHYSLFIIHYSLKNLSPTVFTVGDEFCLQNPRYHPRLRETRWVLPSSLRGNGARRQILPRTRGSARSALGSPFAQAPSRLHSIGGSLERGGCGTILRRWFMMLYHSTFFVICQGVSNDFSQEGSVDDDPAEPGGFISDEDGHAIHVASKICGIGSHILGNSQDRPTVLRPRKGILLR